MVHIKMNHLMKNEGKNWAVYMKTIPRHREQVVLGLYLIKLYAQSYKS